MALTMLFVRATPRQANEKHLVPLVCVLQRQSNPAATSTPARSILRAFLCYAASNSKSPSCENFRSYIESPFPLTAAEKGEAVESDEVSVWEWTFRLG